MRVSVSLPEEDVEWLDSYAATRGIASRSAAVHRAVRLLRASELSADYEAAWAEWSAGEDEQLWDSTSGDGMG
jgi:Arc/MetJ-type ribon-helix-helix transcriptional regulator